jgi:hypothetical protein
VTGSDQIDSLRKVEEKIDQWWESRAGRASCSIIDLMGALEENRFRTIALSLYKQKLSVDDNVSFASLSGSYGARIGLLTMN